MIEKKGITSLGVFSLAVGAMISSGLFILPSIAFAEAGSGIIVAYFIAGVCMIPAVLTKLELSSAMPKAGGAFFYLARIFGAPVGVLTGFADWFSIALKSAFALVGIGVFGSILFPSAGETEFKLIACMASLFFMVLNLLSVRITGRFQIIMVFTLLSILVAYILIGYRQMDFAHLGTGMRLDALKILAAVDTVFVSYGGLTKIGTIVEEVRDAEKKMVPGLLSAFTAVQIIYLLVLFVTMGAMSGNDLASSYSPLTDAARMFSADSRTQGIFVAAVALAGLLAFFTTANAGIFSASRVPYAMSRDGMLPPLFGRNSGKGIPVPSVVATSLFIILAIILLDVKELAKVASLFLMLVFLLENLGLLVIRRSGIAAYRPTFRSPFFPFIQIAGVLVYGILIALEGFLPLIIALAFTILNMVWYVLYAKKGWSKTSAFVAMLKKSFSPELSQDGNDLEDELLSILLERDNIREDRFDLLIRNAAIIDYADSVDRETVFREVSRLLSGRHGLDAEKLERKFREREDQTSTLIYPGVAVPHAIPHIVVEGNSLFDIVLVRSKQGIRWTDDETVHTAFFMIGSRDERNFHLRALMSIAQTLQDPGFLPAWMAAATERELKTALILSRRKRHH